MSLNVSFLLDVFWVFCQLMDICGFRQKWVKHNQVFSINTTRPYSACFEASRDSQPKPFAQIGAPVMDSFVTIIVIVFFQSFCGFWCCSKERTCFLFWFLQCLHWRAFRKVLLNNNMTVVLYGPSMQVACYCMPSIWSHVSRGTNRMFSAWRCSERTWGTSGLLQKFLTCESGSQRKRLSCSKQNWTKQYSFRWVYAAFADRLESRVVQSIGISGPSGLKLGPLIFELVWVHPSIIFQDCFSSQATECVVFAACVELHVPKCGTLRISHSSPRESDARWINAASRKSVNNEKMDPVV